MKPHNVLLIVTSLALLAGCLDPQTGSGNADPKRLVGAPKPFEVSIPEGWSELAMPYGGDHDHTDHAQHENLTTANFEVLGYNPLITDYYGRTSGGHFCGDAREHDGRRLSVTHSWTSDVAFIISDVTDAANPEKIGELVMLSTHVYDLAISADFRYVLLATSPLGLNDNLPVQPPVLDGQIGWFRDACSGNEIPLMGPEANAPFSPGLVLVDIQNPRNPTVVDFRMFPYLGGHSVTTAMVNGELLIVTSVANIPGQLSHYVFLEILDTPAGAKLNIVGEYRYVPTTPQGQQEMATVTNHDATIHKHPITGEQLAYLAYGNLGLVIINIDNPLQPVYRGFIAPWDHVPGAEPDGYIHEALPIDEVWDGKHYTFVGDECVGRPSKTPTCLAYVIDTTDPTDPQIAGAWTLPHEPEWGGGLMWSLHYLGYQNRTLFASVYHAGLWAIDVSQLTTGVATSLPSIGVFMPELQSPKPVPRGQIDFSPQVDDLNVFPDGVIVVYDSWTGLYTVRFHDENPAPAPEPWPLE